MWKKCGQKFLKQAKERKSPNLWTKTDTSPKCSSEVTQWFWFWGIPWQQQNKQNVWPPGGKVTSTVGVNLRPVLVTGIKQPGYCHSSRTQTDCPKLDKIIQALLQKFYVYIDMFFIWNVVTVFVILCVYMVY